MARTLFIVGTLIGTSFALSSSAEAVGFIYDLSSRSIQGKDISDVASINLGSFNYSTNGSGSSGSLNVSQNSQLDATVISGTFTSQVHGITVVCESVLQNDLWANFRVPQDTPYRFTGTTTHRLQRVGNPLEEFCEGPFAYLFGTSNAAPYIQTFIDFPFDSSGALTVSNSFDVSGIFRSNATHSLYITLPTGAKIGAGGTGSVDSTRTLTFTLSLILPPSLSVKRSPSSITMNWPASATNYVLESALSPASTATWSAVTNSATSANGTNSVNIGTSVTNRFFRLRKTGT